MANPLEQLGVENRSMAGAVLMHAAVVETGEVSVVANEGLLESSFSLCSFLQKHKPRNLLDRKEPSDWHVE